MRRTYTLCKGVALLLTLSSATGQQLQCPGNADGLAFRMLESNIGRGDGILPAGSVNGLIELGIFQQALRESITYTNDTKQKERWTAYLHKSTSSVLSTFNNASRDAELPLDRLSVGTSFLYEARTGSKDNAEAIAALQESVKLQPRNVDGSLWYYNNVANLTAYHNLSYLDGMYSYPTFAILSANHTSDTEEFGSSAALRQVELLYERCKDDYGLIKHGFDASKSHKWANAATGCSPVVWSRALAWYTLGIVESLEILRHSKANNEDFVQLKSLLAELFRGQLRASDRSLQIEGSYGVWQVVDYPGATFGGYSNYIEASGSLMTAFSFLKSVRLGFIAEEELAQRARLAGVGIYQGALQDFLIRNANGTQSLNGTSSVASLAGDVDFMYYVTRPTVLNNLKGTSAFILASLEVEKLCRTTY